MQRGDVLAFDVNLKEPSLVDYLPRLTETAEIDDTFGKMALMDQLIINDGLSKVIDLGYPSFVEFFGMIEEIGFVKESARSEVAPVVLSSPTATVFPHAAIRPCGQRCRPTPSLRSIMSSFCAENCPKLSCTIG